MHRNGCVFWTVAMMHECGSEHVLFWIVFNTSCRYKTSHNKLCNWHADSSRRSIVERSRERIAPRDLEPNLSQMLHLVLVHSKLVIFIYKQLKRPVAFSAVQCHRKLQFRGVVVAEVSFLSMNQTAALQSFRPSCRPTQVALHLPAACS